MNQDFSRRVRRNGILVSLALASLASWSTSACTSGGDVDLGRGRDAGRATPRTDLCGNGIDDDQNGAIDDGCPCGPGEVQRCSLGTVAESEVGACMAGTQTCAVASGVEWGDWGDYACSGAVGPAETEACDGVDDDCDGTIDEGCPCEAGATRACATEFLTAPCTAGTQTCSGGTWSSCEGAITPTAEVCADGVDNDCDGTVDPTILCACVPTAEVCRDGVDNDCDGTTDEAECTPDWPGDAGVDPGVDAGPDAGVDVDAGPATCDDPAWCVSGPSAVTDFGPVRNLLGYDDPIELASDGHRLFAAFQLTGASGGTDELITELDASGAALFEVTAATNVAGGTHALAWSGTHVLAALTPILDDTRGGDVRVAAIDPTTHAVVTTTIDATLGALAGPLGTGRGEVAVGWTAADGGGRFQRLSTSGVPIGPVVPLGASLTPTSIARTANGWLVGLARTVAPRGSLYGFVAEDALVTTTELVNDGSLALSSGARIAASCDGALACWRDTQTFGLMATVTEHCQAIDVDGTLLGTASTLFGTHRYGAVSGDYVDVLAAGDDFVVHTEYARPEYLSLNAETFLRFGADGRERSRSDESLARNYGYGALAIVDDCVVFVGNGNANIDGVGTRYQPYVRRLCSMTCE